MSVGCVFNDPQLPFGCEFEDCFHLRIIQFEKQDALRRIEFFPCFFIICC